MLVERETILEAYALIESRWPHVVLMEDVSKSYRNPRWIYAIVQDCVDGDIRVIAPGDNLDTYDENWEVTLGAAALRHGLHIPDTRRRIRRTSSKSFADGGMVLRVRAGYRKLTKEEAASGQFGPKGLRLAIVPEWTPRFQKLRELVLQENSGGALLAHWLNSQDPPVPPPPYCKQKRWVARLILDLLRDPLLYGLRQFPKVRHEPRFGDGKHKRKKNPTPQQQYSPELAHMTEAQWKEMVAKLDENNGKEDQRCGSQSPRFQVARHKTLAPLQHARCFGCGDVYYPVGNDRIKCSNALKHDADGCWNHVQVSCTIIREKLVDLLLTRMDRHPLARQAFLDAAWSQIEQARRRGRRSVTDLDKEIANLDEQGERISEAIAVGGKLEMLVQKLKTVEAARKAAMKRRADASEISPEDRLPESMQSLEIRPRQALIELANSSFEFAELLRKLLPRFVIQPVQALDSGQVHPRGFLTLDLSALSPRKDGAGKPEPEEFVIDFFESPVHIHHVAGILALKQAKILRNEKHSLTVLADELKINRMTVKRALGYAKLMQAAGLSEPYRLLAEAPKEASRWKPRRKKPDDDSDAAAA